MKCGVHEELCELSGEARIGELRRVVRGVVAAHLSGVGDAFEMCLVPEGISLDDDESVAHLSAGSCGGCAVPRVCCRTTQSCCRTGASGA